jgi:hypothetical protein
LEAAEQYADQMYESHRTQFHEIAGLTTEQTGIPITGRDKIIGAVLAGFAFAAARMLEAADSEAALKAAPLYLIYLARGLQNRSEMRVADIYELTRKDMQDVIAFLKNPSPGDELFEKAKVAANILEDEEQAMFQVNFGVHEGLLGLLAEYLITAIDHLQHPDETKRRIANGALGKLWVLNLNRESGLAIPVEWIKNLYSQRQDKQRIDVADALISSIMSLEGINSKLYNEKFAKLVAQLKAEGYFEKEKVASGEFSKYGKDKIWQVQVGSPDVASPLVSLFVGTQEDKVAVRAARREGDRSIKKISANQGTIQVGRSSDPPPQPSEEDWFEGLPGTPNGIVLPTADKNYDSYWSRWGHLYISFNGQFIFIRNAGKRPVYLFPVSQSYQEVFGEASKKESDEFEGSFDQILDRDRVLPSVPIRGRVEVNDRGELFLDIDDLVLEHGEPLELIVPLARNANRVEEFAGRGAREILHAHRILAKDRVFYEKPGRMLNPQIKKPSEPNLQYLKPLIERVQRELKDEPDEIKMAKIFVEVANRLGGLHPDDIKRLENKYREHELFGSILNSKNLKSIRDFGYETTGDIVRKVREISTFFEDEPLGLGFFIANQSGVCRHRAFLFYLLAQAVGLKTILKRGTVPGGRHAWVEIELKKGRRMFADVFYAPDIGDYLREVEERLFLSESFSPQFSILHLERRAEESPFEIKPEMLPDDKEHMKVVIRAKDPSKRAGGPVKNIRIRIVEQLNVPGAHYKIEPGKYVIDENLALVPEEVAKQKEGSNRQWFLSQGDLAYLILEIAKQIYQSRVAYQLVIDREGNLVIRPPRNPKAIVSLDQVRKIEFNPGDTKMGRPAFLFIEYVEGGGPQGDLVREGAIKRVIIFTDGTIGKIVDNQEDLKAVEILRNQVKTSRKNGFLASGKNIQFEDSRTGHSATPLQFLPTDDKGNGIYLLVERDKDSGKAVLSRDKNLATLTYTYPFKNRPYSASLKTVAPPSRSELRVDAQNVLIRRREQNQRSQLRLAAAALIRSLKPPVTIDSDTEKAVGILTRVQLEEAEKILRETAKVLLSRDALIDFSVIDLLIRRFRDAGHKRAQAAKTKDAKSIIGFAAPEDDSPISGVIFEKLAEAVKTAGIERVIISGHIPDRLNSLLKGKYTSGNFRRKFADLYPNKVLPVVMPHPQGQEDRFANGVVPIWGISDEVSVAAASIVIETFFADYLAKYAVPDQLTNEESRSLLRAEFLRDAGFPVEIIAVYANGFGISEGLRTLLIDLHIQHQAALETSHAA